MRPDVPPDQDPSDGDNIVDPAVFQQRRIGHLGPESLLARASAAERAVVSLEGRLQEIERELRATALQRDELAVELRQHHTSLRGSARPTVAPVAAVDPGARAKPLAARLEDRLREVDGALVALGSRLREEKLAREASQAALAAQRTAYETQVAVLREALVSDAERTRTRLQEIEAELERLRDGAVGLERDRDAARAELKDAGQQLAARDSELLRVRGENGAADEQLEMLRSELSETRAALETARGAQAAAEWKANEERLARERAEAQLHEERVTFAQQLDIADGQLRAEIETQRRAFAEHTAAVEESIALLHRQLADARAESEPKDATPPIDSLKVDLERAAARLRELAQDDQREDDDHQIEAVGGDTESAAPADLKARVDDLAQAIEQASAESAVQAEAEPLPRRDLPGEPVIAWMAPAFERLYAEEPQTAGRVVVDLLPALAGDLGRDALLDFAIDELGAYRLTAHMGRGSISSWRTGASRRADLALAGSALALSPFALGGAGRRLPKGVESSGRRRALWRLLRVRRRPVALDDLQLAGVVPGLGNLLALLAANVEPEWIAGNHVAIGFATTGAGAGSWVVRPDEHGKPKVTPGVGEPDAVITVPADAIVPLFAGIDTPIAGQPTFTGDAHKALLLLGWFDRAQRSAS